MKRTSLPLRRRDFIAGLGNAAAWPLVARARHEPERWTGETISEKQALYCFLRGL
jgi:hypothetical protein